jgi:hypothetical protein
MSCRLAHNPAGFDFCAVIQFLHTKNMSDVEIHSELCTVYDQNVMSAGTVIQWYRMFKDGRTSASATCLLVPT